MKKTAGLIVLLIVLAALAGFAMAEPQMGLVAIDADTADFTYTNVSGGTAAYTSATHTLTLTNYAVSSSVGCFSFDVDATIILSGESALSSELMNDAITAASGRSLTLSGGSRADKLRVSGITMNGGTLRVEHCSLDVLTCEAGYTEWQALQFLAPGAFQVDDATVYLNPGETSEDRGHYGLNFNASDGDALQISVDHGGFLKALGQSEYSSCFRCNAASQSLAMTISNGSRVETQYGYDFLGRQCTVNLTTDADSVFQGEGTDDYPFSGSSITLNGNIFFEGRVSAGYSTRYVINGGRVRLPGNTQNNSYITYAQGMEPVLLDGGTGRTWDAPYTCYGFPQYAVSVTGGEALSFDAAIERTIEGQRVVLKTEDQGWDNLKFVHWSTEDADVAIQDATAKQTEFIMPGHDVQLTANFVPATFYTLTFDFGGLTGASLDPVRVLEGAKVDLPAIDTPELNYRVFAGWYTDPERTIPAGIDLIMMEDTTLYADYIWEHTPFSVTVDFNGHGGGGSRTITGCLPGHFSIAEYAMAALAGYETFDDAFANLFFGYPILRGASNRAGSGADDTPSIFDYYRFLPTDENYVLPVQAYSYPIAEMNLRPEYDNYESFQRDWEYISNHTYYNAKLPGSNVTVYLQWLEAVDTIEINFSNTPLCGDSVQAFTDGISLPEGAPYRINEDSQSPVTVDMQSDTEPFMGEAIYQCRIYLVPAFGHAFTERTQVVCNDDSVVHASIDSDGTATLEFRPSHVWSEWMESEPAGEDQRGEQWRGCSVCQAFQTRQTPALDETTYTLTLDMQGHADNIVLEGILPGEPVASQIPDVYNQLSHGNMVFYDFAPEPISAYNCWDELNRGLDELYGGGTCEEPMTMDGDTTLYAIWMQLIVPEIHVERPLCGQNPSDHGPTVSVSPAARYSIGGDMMPSWADWVTSDPDTVFYGDNEYTANVPVKPDFGYWLSDDIPYRDTTWIGSLQWGSDNSPFWVYEIPITSQHWVGEDSETDVWDPWSVTCNRMGIRETTISCGAGCGGCAERHQVVVPAETHQWYQYSYYEPSEDSPGEIKYGCQNCGRLRWVEIPPTSETTYPIAVEYDANFGRFPILDAFRGVPGQTVTIDPDACGNVELDGVRIMYDGLDDPIDITDALRFTMPEASITVYVDYKWKDAIDYGDTMPAPVLPASCEFTGSMRVQIDAPFENALIGYTIDGTDPFTINPAGSDEPFTIGDSAIPYTRPFWIDSTTTVKAAAINPDWQSAYDPTQQDELFGRPAYWISETVSATYTESSWDQLLSDAGSAQNGDTLGLNGNCNAEAGDGPLVIGDGMNLTIDLNGYTIDRRLADPEADGSAIIVEDGGSLTLMNGEVTGGRSSGFGGGVRVEAGGSLTLNYVEISGNTAAKGGGAYVYAGGSIALLGRSCIRGNTSAAGGALYVESGANIRLGAIPMIASNQGGDLWLEGGVSIDASGMSADARINVDMPIPETYVIFTQGLRNGAYSACFTSESGYVASCQGEAILLNSEYASQAIESSLPEDLEMIDEEAFMNTDIRSIQIPYGCQSIGRRAFAGCRALYKIYIPCTVTSIDETAFDGVDFLIVYSDNPIAWDYADNHGFVCFKVE